MKKHLDRLSGYLVASGFTQAAVFLHHRDEPEWLWSGGVLTLIGVILAVVADA